MDITVSRIGSRAFLRLDGASVEIKDYKISSPMHGCTELEVVFELEGGTTEFSSTASSTEHLLQNLLSKSSSP